MEERYSLFVLKSTLIKALRHFPHLDPDGSGPKLDVVAPPTSASLPTHIDTTCSAKTAAAASVVAQVEAETEPRDSIDVSDEEEEDAVVVLEEGDDGDEDEEWEDAEEDWESVDETSAIEDDGSAVQYGWHDWADRCRILHNLR